MTRNISSLIVILGIVLASIDVSYASAPMNSCNNDTGECRATVATLYSVNSNGFIVLSGHLIPSICTNAAWGYYWSLDLTDAADRTRYATALTAYTLGKAIELRSFDSTCKIVTLGMGE